MVIRRTPLKRSTKHIPQDGRPWAAGWTLDDAERYMAQNECRLDEVEVIRLGKRTFRLNGPKGKLP